MHEQHELLGVGGDEIGIAPAQAVGAPEPGIRRELGVRIPLVDGGGGRRAESE